MIAIGPYQGAGRNDGYRIAYSPNGRPWLALLRLSRRGATVLDSVDRPAAGDSGASHALKWSRRRDGTMTFSIDGFEALRAIDRGYRDPFAGVTVVNEGGDFIMQSLAIKETR